MSRSRGAMSLTRSPPITRSPSEISSSPAIIRSAVDFPKPEGPTRIMNSPSATSMLTSLTASKPSGSASRSLSARSRPCRLSFCSGSDQRGERLARAALVQRGQRLAIGAGEALAVGEVAEQVAVRDEGVGVPARAARELGDLVAQAVDDLDRPAL